MTYIEYFEDWFNNWYSVSLFATYHGLSVIQACKVINKGRLLRETNFGAIIDLVPSHTHTYTATR